MNSLPRFRSIVRIFPPPLTILRTRIVNMNSLPRFRSIIRISPPPPPPPTILRTRVVNMNSLPRFRSIIRPPRLAIFNNTISPPPPLLPGPSEIHTLPKSRTSLSHNVSAFIDPDPIPLGEPIPQIFQSSGNPCLDLFNMSLFTPPESVRELLPQAWAHNPLTTLKLILRRRVNCFGLSFCEDDYGEKDVYAMVLWLHQNHPKTLALNVRWFVQLGYMKHLLDILSNENISEAKTEENYSYRFLHDKISDFFAESLKSDIGFLSSGEFSKIGLAEKWCPELSNPLCESIAKRIFPHESHPDIEEADYSNRALNRLWEEILAPLDRFLHLPDGFRNSHVLYIHERMASAGGKTYNNLLKKHQPGRFVKLFDELHKEYNYFSKNHQPTRFFKFVAKLDEWEAMNTPEALLPHEILSYTNIGEEVKKLQWKRVVEDLFKKGKLSNSLSVCHVSRSMNISGRQDNSTITYGKVGDFSRTIAATWMEVIVALGLLISELSEEPWRGNIINISPNPQLHRIQGETPQEKHKFIKRMKCEGSIDFQKVFDRILDVAVASKLDKEKMVKRVFVFTAMGFCQEWMGSWETDYCAIHRKYEEKGYGSLVPEIVFWNMCDLTSYWLQPPIAGREKGVVLISGFSKNLLNIFLENGVANPEEVMEEAIAGEEYQSVSVFD